MAQLRYNENDFHLRTLARTAAVRTAAVRAFGLEA
jgi:hypothetical protein